MYKKVRVWDAPTRIFHWLLVAVIAFQYITAEILDDAIHLHFYGGYVALCLIIFRVLWGVFGSYHARFKSFVVGPKRTYEYAKSLAFHDTSLHLGHNPMGAFSVIAVLSIIATQAVSGLFISDDIFSEGPYFSVVTTSTQEVANWFHHNMFDAIWVFLIFHLGAMVYYKIEKNQNLTVAMITGYKTKLNKIVDAYPDLKGEVDDRINKAPKIKNHWLRFLILTSISILIVYIVVEILPPETSGDLYY